MSVILLALKQPKLVLYRGVLGTLQNVFAGLQDTIVDLYKNSIKATEDHEQEIKAIVTAGNRNQLLLKTLSEHNGDKLSPDEMATLVLRLQDQEESFYKSALGQGLVALYQNVSTMLARKTKTDYTSSAITAFYDKIVAVEPTKSSIAKVEAIYTEISKKGGVYQRNPYQIAIAAELIGTQTQVVEAEVASGDGKTFIQVGIANYHVSNGEEVVIAVVNDMLAEQVQNYIDQYCDH